MKEKLVKEVDWILTMVMFIIKDLTAQYSCDMSNVGPCKKGLIILNNISLSITS
jgi:hypothetical protein